MARPFRFAVQASGAADGRSWRELARKVEDLGYSTLYVPDHLDGQWAPIVALTVAAEATEGLRVGSLVFDNDYRHPVLLARELATLDLASEGRLEAGLGAGWKRSDYESAGIAYDRPGARVDRLAESVAIMKAMWSEGSATFSGAHYRVTGAACSPRRAAGRGPALVLGGGSRRVLSLAASEADIVGINPSLAAGEVNDEVAASSLAGRFAERLEWVREAAGERFAALELQCLTFAAMIVPDAAAVREAMAPSFGITPTQAAEMPIVLVGTEEEICETLERRRELYGLSYWVLHEDAVDSFAPLVARLAGT